MDTSNEHMPPRLRGPVTMKSRHFKANEQRERRRHEQSVRILAAHERQKTPAKVVLILSTNRWYGDGPPCWEGALSAQSAHDKRLAAAERLWRFRSIFDGAEVLAKRLELCRPGLRCMSAACPECARAFQRWTVYAARRLIKSEEAKW
jgi:hypothetical protein